VDHVVMRPPRQRGKPPRAVGPRGDPIVGDLTGADDMHRYVPAGHVHSFPSRPLDVGVIAPQPAAGVTRVTAQPGSRSEGHSESVAMRLVSQASGRAFDSELEYTADDGSAASDAP
jgi:hypothetical protein